jgi:tetratricopeptide (TPR) repeat protein
VAIALLLPLLVLARHRTAVYHDLESLYLDTIAQNPTSWAAHHNLGCYLEARGELTRAVEHYRAAVGCDSSQSRTRISLGAALLLQQQLPEAEQQLTHALTLARDRYDRSYALTLLGNVHTAQKRYADAFANYLAAISEKPDNWSARIAYAAALRESGDFEAALAVLREVAELSPRDAEICSQVGKQLVAAGRMRDSVALFERAVQFAPDQPKFRQEFAEVLFQVREFERAEVQLRELIKLEPRSAHAHNLLGATLANRNEIPAAIEQFRAALRIDPTNREAQQNLARAVRAQN